jgi:hypothetical protein
MATGYLASGVCHATSDDAVKAPELSSMCSANDHAFPAREKTAPDGYRVGSTFA